MIPAIFWGGRIVSVVVTLIIFPTYGFRPDIWIAEISGGKEQGDQVLAGVVALLVVLVMVGGVVMAYLGGLHFWWPKMVGRMYPEFLAKISAVLVFVGFNLTFFPQFIVGYLGMPRRYHVYPEEFQVLNVLSTAGASVLGLGYFLPLCYLVWSLRYGQKASSNPWNAAGLEWQTSSPPPPHNFETTPVVDEEAYEYGERDYHPKEAQLV